MNYRWWADLKQQREDFKGTLSVDKGTYISEDAKLDGNIVIGKNCMIGSGVVIRGNVKIFDDVRIGYGVEIKNSVIKENTTVGPLCYIGDSLIDENVYLGALVRTSNHRLDKANIKSWNGEIYEDTGLEKLGAWIKKNTSLGISVVILPGRIVPENSVFGPQIVITKNYSTGIYKLTQNIMKCE